MAKASRPNRPIADEGHRKDGDDHATVFESRAQGLTFATDELSPTIISIENGSTGYTDGPACCCPRLNLRSTKIDRIALLGLKNRVQGKSTLSQLCPTVWCVDGKADQLEQAGIGFLCAAPMWMNWFVYETPLQHHEFSGTPRCDASKLRAAVAGLVLGPGSGRVPKLSPVGGQKARLSLLLATLECHRIC